MPRRPTADFHLHSVEDPNSIRLRADDEEVELFVKQVDRIGTNVLIRFQPPGLGLPQRAREHSTGFTLG
jgi:hypothetical protein